MRVWERKLSTKLSKLDCTNIISCVIYTMKWWTTFEQLFCFHFFWDKNNKKRVVKRESKNIIKVWEKNLSTKLYKYYLFFLPKEHSFLKLLINKYNNCFFFNLCTLQHIYTHIYPFSLILSQSLSSFCKLFLSKNEILHTQNLAFIHSFKLPKLHAWPPL
jgi:hypothetical protein